ncbi:MAG: alpha/beta hydrolase [Balneolales bacterium]
MMKDIPGIVFIHGAGLGSFIWNELKPLLNYPALFVDFPNRNDPDKVNSGLSLTDYSDSVINQTEAWGKKNIILVCHSIGGIAALKVAEHFGSRITGFIAISAVIPDRNQAFVSCLPFPKKIIMSLLIRMAGTKPPRSAIVQGLCNDLSSEQTQRVIRSFTPEAKSLYLEKCSCGIPNANTLYIKLSKDKEFPVSLQDKMVKNLKAQTVNTLESGHLPMMSVPQQLSAIINDFIDKHGK